MFIRCNFQWLASQGQTSSRPLPGDGSCTLEAGPVITHQRQALFVQVKIGS